jgi:hypothetical protein
MRMRRTYGLAVALAVVLFCVALLPAQDKTSLRTISGTVTDDHHEPLRGAVVELENPASHVVVSFITGTDGQFVFKRVDSHADFTLWATFRGNRSAVHGISMFDSHMDKLIHLVCKTY